MRRVKFVFKDKNVRIVEKRMTDEPMEKLLALGHKRANEMGWTLQAVEE